MNRTSGTLSRSAPRQAAPWWPAALHGRPLWSGLLAAAAGLALLGAFHHVVRDGMGQGETRRRAAAVLADATWRCHVLRGAERVRICIDGLAEPTAAPAPARPAVLLPDAPRSDGAPAAPAPQSTSTHTQPALPRGLPAVNP